MKYIYIIRTARVFSAIFRPYYMPVVGFIGLFSFTYLSLLPFNFKLFILLAIYCFTILIPQICIFCYRKINGWAPHQIRIQTNRTIPYAISIISYVACLWLMYRMHLPRYMCGIIVAALLIQASCAIINIWWKISTHSAGAGGIIGALLAYSTLFDFNIRSSWQQQNVTSTTYTWTSHRRNLIRHCFRIHRNYHLNRIYRIDKQQKQ